MFLRNVGSHNIYSAPHSSNVEQAYKIKKQDIYKLMPDCWVEESFHPRGSSACQLMFVVVFLGPRANADPDYEHELFTSVML
jgi:hypothetical protein